MTRHTHSQYHHNTGKSQPTTKNHFSHVIHHQLKNNNKKKRKRKYPLLLLLFSSFLTLFHIPSKQNAIIYCNARSCFTPAPPLFPLTALDQLRFFLRYPLFLCFCSLDSSFFFFFFLSVKELFKEIAWPETIEIAGLRCQRRLQD